MYIPTIDSRNTEPQTYIFLITLLYWSSTILFKNNHLLKINIFYLESENDNLFRLLNISSALLYERVYCICIEQNLYHLSHLILELTSYQRITLYTSKILPQIKKFFIYNTSTGLIFISLASAFVDPTHFLSFLWTNHSLLWYSNPNGANLRWMQI